MVAAAVLVETAVPRARSTAPTTKVAKVALTRSRWFPEKSAIPSSAAPVKVAVTANWSLCKTKRPTRNVVVITRAVRPAFCSERWSGS